MSTANSMFNKEKNPTLEITSIADFNKFNVRSFLSQVSEFYPGFDAWLNFKFLRGLASGERKVLIIQDKGEIAGVSLIKISTEEKKICTFYISPIHTGRGFGTKLMADTLAHFEGSVDITVCEERNSELSCFLIKCGFNLVSTRVGCYRPQTTEYFYTR